MKFLLNLVFAATLLGLPMLAIGQTPLGTAFSYQGQLMEDGVPVNDPVDLRFQLWDSETDGDTVGSVDLKEGVLVSDGLFTVELDFGGAVFSGDSLWMEVEVSAAGANTYSTLSPRRRILASPNALYAATAGTVEGGIDDADADPTNEYNTDFYFFGTRLEIEDGGGVMEVDLSGLVESAGYTGYSLNAPGGLPEDLLLVDSAGRVGIGTDAPQAQLHVTGPNLPLSPRQLGFVDQISPGVFFSNATDVVVQDNFAYVGNGSIIIFDVTDPENITLVKYMNAQDAEWEEIAGARHMLRIGDALIVSAQSRNAITLLNVSDPANAVVYSTIRNGENGVVNMESPRGFQLVGSTLYVACAFSDSLSIIDLTDPANPTQLGSAADDGSNFQNLEFASDVAVTNNVAFVVSQNSDALTAIDVSNPAAPTEIASFISGQDSFPDIGNPSSIEIRGTTAYIGTGLGLAMFDISTPSSPIFLGSIEDDGSGDLSDVRRIAVDGDYAYLPALGSRSVTIVDVSDPTDPQRVSILKKGRPGSENLLIPFGVFVEGDRFYVVSTQTGELTVFGTDSAGETLRVDGDAVISGGTGSVSLMLEADTENSNESSQPNISFSQDGGAITARMGFFDAANNFQIFAEGETTSHLLLNSRNNVGINHPSPDYPLHVGTDTSNGNGAHVTAGGTWTNGSSRAWKTNFRQLEPMDILDRLVNLPVTQWEYTGTNEGTHMGPTAEDFRAAFGLGDSDQYISTVDADGVAFGAIKGLNQKLEEKQAEIDRLEARIARLEALIAAQNQEVTE